MSTLNVLLVQTQLVWEDPARNHTHLAEMLSGAPPADLAVLPEMFATGFSMHSGAIAETMDGPSMGWLRQQAQSRGGAVCGSLAIREGDRVFNRFVFAAPGQEEWYDKRHLFRMGGEHQRYSAGRERRTFGYRGWRILPQVCYDLRFPVWSRSRDDYDLAIYVANWPAARTYAWRQLLIARAIENQCYVIGVNRVGEDGNKLDYAGDSLVINPKGQPLLDLGRRDTAAACTLDLEELRRFREQFPVHMDADAFRLE